MALGWSARIDNRLVDMPMAPITCHECGARVLARKSSWNQTSVQWNTEATARCRERAEADRLAGHDAGLFLACSALRDSIQAAVVAGGLRIAQAQ